MLVMANVIATTPPVVSYACAIVAVRGRNSRGN
jgi:hypothetical protein